jgi:hypothetical protein
VRALQDPAATPPTSRNTPSRSRSQNISINATSGSTSSPASVFRFNPRHPFSNARLALPPLTKSQDSTSYPPSSALDDLELQLHRPEPVTLAAGARSEILSSSPLDEFFLDEKGRVGKTSSKKKRSGGPERTGSKGRTPAAGVTVTREVVTVVSLEPDEGIEEELGEDGKTVEAVGKAW